MPLPVTDQYDQLFAQGVPLLDVRAPVEFHQGAFPGATNLPILDDQQRHDVGLCYKHKGQDAAIALGEQLVSGACKAERIESWSNWLKANPGGCLYCFRGGLRSRITQQWLAEAGFEVTRVAGGYKAMRRYLINALADNLQNLPMVVISGRTGSGKTLLLARLPGSIDLEALAHHRGSSFGRLLDRQPGNIDFENALSVALLQFREATAASAPVALCDQFFSRPPWFVEDEGKIIGSVHLPEALRERLLHAPVIMLEASEARRIEVTREAYVDQLLALYRQRDGQEQGIDAFAAHHGDSLARIRKRFGGARHQQTVALFEHALQAYRQHGDSRVFDDYLRVLLVDYYDPMYDYQLQNKPRQVLFRGSADEIVNWVTSGVRN